MKRQILAWLGLAIYQLYYLHPLVSGAAALALQARGTYNWRMPSSPSP